MSYRKPLAFGWAVYWRFLLWGAVFAFPLRITIPSSSWILVKGWAFFSLMTPWNVLLALPLKASGALFVKGILTLGSRWLIRRIVKEV
jgi:hypothetical protein